VAELITGLEPETVRRNLERVRGEIADAARSAGRDPRAIEILAAVKYVPHDELDVLAKAGIELVGENRAQDLERKVAAAPGRFTWDFIGALQSRKVKAVLPYVRYIHSVATDSALEQLARHGSPETKILVEVNVAGDPGKSGVSPADLPGFLERSEVAVVGLMTMPPLASDPEHNRRHFAALRELADRHDLAQLSMGTSQDFLVAVQEGATIVRLGTTLYKPS
jgi:uncharacterized pyridoxal phosphate-containing UPF0001 family protein